MTSLTKFRAWSELRTAGMIAGTGDALTVTPAGIAAAGPVERPNGAKAIAFWQTRLGSGAPRALFDATLRVYPQSITRQRLSEATGYSLTSSTFFERDAISSLRTLALIRGRDPVVAAGELFS